MTNDTSRNWAGNVAFHAVARQEPRSLEELQELVASSARIRVLGSGHSFSPLADTAGTQVSLRQIAQPAIVHDDHRRAWVSAASTYGEVASDLLREGWALANLASLPHITVAGACATATHGSGVSNRCLAAAVTSVELVRADGGLVTFTRTLDTEFAGAVVGLGSLGVVTRLEIEIEPAYDMTQQVWLDLPLSKVLDHLDELLGCGYSVSLFTNFSTSDTVNQIWVKRRVGQLSADTPAAIGGRGATENVHPIAGLDPRAATPQLGQPGPSHERLPHFRASAIPSNGDELQSEWLVPRPTGAAALERLQSLADRLVGVVQVCEVRAVAADDLWLSPAFRRDAVAIHLTWRRDVQAVAAVLPAVEAALEPFAPRPHWAKVFAITPDTVAAGYPAMPAFRQLAEQMDPERSFANPFVDAFLGRGETG
jgi:xylitol oxidase